MRICLYTSTTLPKVGGQELVVHALAQELARLGHAVTVLAPTPHGRVPTDDEQKPYRVIRHPRFISTHWFVSTYGRFIRSASVECGGFDVINTHDTYPTGWLAVRNRGSLKSAVVITSHGGDLNEGNVRIVKPGVLGRCAEAIAGADGLVSIGRFTERNFRRVAHNGELRTLTTIPNGVHPEEFAADRATRPESLQAGKYLLFLGRLHARKGLDVLLRAVARQPEVRLLVAGSGDEASSLKALAGELGLIGSGRVTFLGRVVGAEKVWLLRNACAVVMPSRGWEACPLVALEAAAAGRPVIASRIPGLEDLVIDGQTGRLVAEENAEGLAWAIGELWHDPAKAGTWGEAACNRAQQFAWARIANQYVQTYESAIARRRAGKQLIH